MELVQDPGRRLHVIRCVDNDDAITPDDQRHRRKWIADGDKNIVRNLVTRKGKWETLL